MTQTPGPTVSDPAASDAIGIEALHTPLTLERFAAETAPFVNHICVLFESELVRLVGVHEDEHDFYYRVRGLQRGEMLASAVGACVSLKAAFPADRYAVMDDLFAGNGAGRVEAFLITREADEAAMAASAGDRTGAYR